MRASVGVIEIVSLDDDAGRGEAREDGVGQQRELRPLDVAQHDGSAEVEGAVANQGRTITGASPWISTRPVRASASRRASRAPRLSGEISKQTDRS